jgi:formylmethanofuran dehydrogenase subunit C
MSGTVSVTGNVTHLVVHNITSGTVLIGGQLFGGFSTLGIASDALVKIDGGIAAEGELLVWGGGPSGYGYVRGELHIGDLDGCINITGELDQEPGAMNFGSVAIHGGISATGRVHLSSIDGTVTIHGDVSPPDQDNEISILVDDLIAGSATPDQGIVHVVGQMAGSVQAGGMNRGGTLRFGGDVPGTILIGGNCQGGAIILDGNLGDADAPDDPSRGHIAINGDLNGDARVTVAGSLVGNAAYIAVDYDGWDYGDNWDNPAFVQIGNTPYYENTPAARVWEISGCRGDMNNDGDVGFADINPFVLALSNPSGYDLEFAGLGGSRDWHGDVNCDGDFGFNDINPFVALIGDPPECCEPQCQPYGGDAQTLGTPAQTAALLYEHVAPELRPALVGIVDAYVADEKDEVQREFWTAVLEELKS